METINFKTGDAVRGRTGKRLPGTVGRVWINPDTQSVHVEVFTPIPGEGFTARSWSSPERLEMVPA